MIGELRAGGLVASLLAAVPQMLQLLPLLQTCARCSYTDAKPMRFKGDFDPFKVLELPRSTTLPQTEVVKKAFKKQALKWHPDRCSRQQAKLPEDQRVDCEAKMETVKLAQEVLSSDRSLQMWEAWDRDRRGIPDPDAGRKPFGGGRSFGGGSSFGGGHDSDDPFGGFGSAFGRNFHDLGSSTRRHRTKPTPAPKPRRPPAPAPRKEVSAGEWRELSREASIGKGNAKVEVITRERDLHNSPLVQVETLERTCYPSQVGCQEKVIERRRRRRDQEL